MTAVVFTADVSELVKCVDVVDSVLLACAADWDDTAAERFGKLVEELAAEMIVAKSTAAGSSDNGVNFMM